MLPRIEMAGNLVADPELRFTPTGTAVCKFRVACNDRKLKDGQWVDGDTTFLDVTVWKMKAETAAEALSKGSKVMVVGRLAQRTWETLQGERRTSYEVTADEVGQILTAASGVTRSTTPAGEDPWATNNWASSEPPF